jgi:hypothetical protein
MTLFDAFRGRALAPGGADAPPPFGRNDALPVGGLVAAHVAMFWRVLFTPAMFFFRDVFSYSYPHARFIREMCLAGQLPYWNPSLNFGEPILANPNFLFFYPSTLLLVALPLDLGYTLHYILHFILAGVGTYGLARRWNQSRLAAFFAGFVFSFSGPVLSLGNLYNHAAAVAWIPWALLLTDIALASPSRRPWVLLTCVFALQFLASEPLTLMATFLLCVAYAFYIAGERKPLAPANLQILATFGVVGALMLALSAIELFPSVALLNNSRRGVEGLPFLETTSWSFHPLQLIEVVIPEFFGSATDNRTTWSSVLASRNLPYFLSFFVGFVPVFLACLGFRISGDRRAKFAGVSGGIVLLLAFGRFTPVFALAYLVFPPLGIVRFPVKLLIPALLFVALLAGWGADAMRSGEAIPEEQRSRIVTWLVCFLILLIAVWLMAFVAPGLIAAPAGWILTRTYQMFTRLPNDRLTSEEVQGAVQFLLRMLQLHLPGLGGYVLGGALWIRAREQGLDWARRVVPALLFFGMAHMGWVNSSANPTVPHSFYDFRPPVLAHFDSTGKPYRYAYLFRETATGKAAIDSQGFLNFESIPEAKGLPPLAEIPFRDRMILAKASMLTGAEGVMNIDVERSFPISLYDYWVFALKELDDPARTSCLLGRSNVRYQVLKERAVAAVSSPPRSLEARAGDEDIAATGREVAEIFNGSPNPHLLWEIPCAMPRAFAAGKAAPAASARDALQALSDPAFDARGTVFVPAGTFQPAPSEEAGPAGDVEIASYTSNEVILHTTLTKPGYVVLLDRFDPSWHATLDGREVSVLRANHIFRAVQVQEGKHEVRFHYEQRGLRSGLAVSLAALALLVVLYFRR